MHWFIDPIRNHYVDFEGRATRREYWMYTLMFIIVYLIIGVVETALKTELISLIVLLALFFPSIALGARRLHDTNRSGWWQLIGIIPVVGWIVLLVFTVQDSDVGTNRFGPNPKAGAPAAPAAPVPPAASSD